MLIWPGLAHQLLALDRTTTLSCTDVITDTNPVIYAAWAIGCLSLTSRFVLLQLALSAPLAVIVAWFAGGSAARVNPPTPRFRAIGLPSC